MKNNISGGKMKREGEAKWRKREGCEDWKDIWSFLGKGNKQKLLVGSLILKRKRRRRKRNRKKQKVSAKWAVSEGRSGWG